MNPASISATFLCACLFALPLGGAGAAEPGDCISFAWPIATEIEWLKAADTQAVASGETLDARPQKAIALSLLPTSNVKFVIGPPAKRKNASAETFGGIVQFAGAHEAGTYQISLPKRGWIDVVQNGKALVSTAHSSKTGCDALRKSVRFDIPPGPFSIELSGFTEDAIKFAIRRAK